MYASLKDVAAHAGVSFQTASKSLCGARINVPTATRERVLKAARELDYIPNAVARGLVTQTTATIGIVADELGDWALTQLVVGAISEARARGHAVLISSLSPES